MRVHTHVHTFAQLRLHDSSYVCVRLFHMRGFQDKRVLVRVDYNCPTDDVTQTITDTARIDTTVPSLQAIFEVKQLPWFKFLRDNLIFLGRAKHSKNKWE